MDFAVQEMEFRAQAHWHHFHYRIGELIGLDRNKREVELAPYLDNEGSEVLGRRLFHYDTLIIAVGSTTNDFGTPGAAECAISLDNPQQAALFHSKLLNACLRANAQGTELAPGQLHIAIIGAGATGVELAAELHNTIREFVAFGLDRIVPERDIKITMSKPRRASARALRTGGSTAVSELLKK